MIKKEKKKIEWTTGKIIATIFIGYLIIQLIGVILIVVFALITDSMTKVKYTTKDNEITIDKGNYKATITNSTYDEENECYVIYINLDKENNKVKNKTLNFYFSIYDKDGYNLGTATTAMDTPNKNDTKWKLTAQYCGSDANTVSSYELTDIYNY